MSVIEAWLLARVAPDGGRWNRVELIIRDIPRPLLWALLAALALGLLVSVFTLARVRRAPRVRLLLLRALAAAVLALLVLGPSLELQQATRIPTRVAVLVDRSTSMSLKDGDRTRLDRARELLAPMLADLGKRFALEIHAFDETSRPLSHSDLAALTATGARTDLSGALAALRARDEDGALAGIVLVSDGVDTVRLHRPEDVARRRAEWPEAPVFPVLPADPGAFRDLALADLRYDPFGFVRHELGFEVKLRARGFPGRRVDVSLYQDGAPLTSRTVEVKGEAEVAPLSFRVRPDRPGTFLYSIEAREAPGEAVTANNKVEFLVTVGRDQTRVLLICGRPSWDERFLRQMLKKDPNVDLVSFFILRDEDDSPGVPQDELSLIPFPVNDLFTTELQSFDVIILQNFTRSFSRSLALSTLHLENVREFVVEKGGGLLLVGGNLGLAASGYAGSPIEDILPFRLSQSGPESDESAFQARLTDEGTSHFITSLEPDVEATRALFAALPALDGANRVGPVTGGGTALLVHPSLTADSAPMPVLAARAAGKGRTLGLTADTTWYWGFKVVGRGGSNRDYLRFWQNAMRWLAQDPASKFLTVSLAAERVEPDRPMGVRVRALRGDYSPLVGGRVRVDVAPSGRGGDRRQPADSRNGLTDADGSFRFESARAAEGFYRVRAELLDPRGAVLDRDEKLFEVRSDRTELEDPGLRPELLEAIASATGGRLLTGEGRASPPIPDREVYRLAERRRIDLWDNALVYALLLAALAGEWWLRRRAGLL